MVPKTAIQKTVVGLSAKLPAITEKQTQFAFNNSFDAWAIRQRTTLYCLECGHSWKDKSVLASTLLGCTCPNCTKLLKMRTDYSKACKDAEYFSILAVKGGMQVVRMFYVTKYLKKLQVPIYGIYEVMQHWVEPTGKVTTMSKKVQGLSQYYDQWILDSELEVRPKPYNSCPRYALGAYKIYPERRILPEIKRNGFKGNLHGLTPQHFFNLILSDPRAETLLKAKQVELFKSRSKYQKQTDEHWQSVKICIRNRYIVKDTSIWFDHIDLLKHFGKDLRNQKYICPANLKREHTRLVEKKREQDKKIRIEKMRERLDKEQVKYAEQKSRFFDLAFCEADIAIKPLESVEEFMNEGDNLKHCVFTNGYHKKVDSLIFSARVKGVPIETIEVSLKKMEVVQSRGMRNKATSYHERILDLVRANIPQISQRLTV